jgi:tRNA threonylcarbamoyladenosine biosynthesis protein TsaE
VTEQEVFILKTRSAEETKQLAKEIASLLKKGDVVSLSGALGTGKTVFAQGIAEGLGIKDHVTSPSFTLIKEYHNSLPLYHFDIYRLTTASELIDLGYEEYFYGEGISVIEWGEKIKELLPEDHLEVKITRLGEESFRRIEIIPHGLAMGKRWQNFLKSLRKLKC